MTVPLTALAALAAAATAPASFTQELGSPFAVGASTYGVVTADFSADGRPDIAAVNGTVSNSSVSLLERLPGGRFTVKAPVAIGNGANFATSADFDGDTRPDLAVSNFWSQQVSILLTQPNGTFAHGLNSQIGLPGKAAAIASGDFDRDGDVDLAVGNWDGAQVIVLRRVPGGFELGPTATTGVTPRFVAPADFNGDGDLDLAVTNHNDGTLTILIGQSGAGFAPDGAAIPVGLTPGAVTADDLDGDGRPDLAVAGYGSNTVRLFMRQSGSFVPLPPIAVPKGPIGVAAGDFNSDGLRDLAVGSNTASTVSILLRAPDGGYSHDPSSPIPTDRSGGAYSVAVADFDADTRQDVAVTNDAGGSVTVLLNTTPFPSPPPPPPAPNLDADGDGVQRPLDCDDYNAAIKPGANDQPSDGIDQDCRAGDAPYPLLDRGISAFLATYRSHTKFTSLAVKRVRAGDIVRLTCRGAGCPLRRKTIRVKNDRKLLPLTGKVKGAKLRRGAVVKLRVTRPETIGTFAGWKMRSPKPPKRKDACLPPGAKRPKSCPN